MNSKFTIGDSVLDAECGQEMIVSGVSESGKSYLCWWMDKQDKKIQNSFPQDRLILAKSKEYIPQKSEDFADEVSSHIRVKIDEITPKKESWISNKPKENEEEDNPKEFSLKTDNATEECWRYFFSLLSVPTSKEKEVRMLFLENGNVKEVQIKYVL